MVSIWVCFAVCKSNGQKYTIYLKLTKYARNLKFGIQRLFFKKKIPAMTDNRRIQNVYDVLKELERVIGQEWSVKIF